MPTPAALYGIYTDTSPSLPDQIARAVAPQGVCIDTDPVAFADAPPCVEQLIHDLMRDMGSSNCAWAGGVA